MPVNIKVIRPKDFIKTTVTGVLDFAVSKQALLDIASQIDQPGEYEILVDTRGAEPALSMVDIFQLGEALAAHASLRRSKIAFLKSKKDSQQTEFLETVTANRGVRAQVFTDFEEAVTWLVMQEAL
ncbi:MAG TPA: hypothetical protein VFL31_03775 [Nitrospiraceae bacterium]|nr:hypothetical protein [Nitrospiraceae bacterium]